MYLLLAKVLGPIVLLAGLWFWHVHAVSSADKTGYDRGIAQWRAADNIAKAVGDETTALLKRGAAANEGKLHAKLADLEKRGATSDRTITERSNTINELRIALDASTAQALGSTATTASGSDDASLKQCRGLLSTSLGVAGEADKLVETGQRLLKTTAAKLEALQDDARAVRAAIP